MKYSELFAKTDKNVKQYDSTNASLLIKGGFIDQVMSGVYTFLPLGNRVLTKIENIVRKEMDNIGVEILMPSLSPREYWENTDRIDSVDILFQASGANELSQKLNSASYILNPTHEEVVTPLAKRFRRSYRDFPFAVYQIQTKFRNEARPKSGLLRAREFRMKDLYSFHTSAEDMKAYYEKVKEAYWNILDKLEIKEDTVLAAASGGTFTDDFSHEFQTKCETGEDLIFKVPSTGESFNKEVAPSKAPAFKQDPELKQMEDHLEPGIIGVDELCKAFNVRADQSVKTLIFETNNPKQPVIVAALRGDYDINEIKLMKLVSCTKMRLASEEIVYKVTGAHVGYAGIVNLPSDIPIYIDDSIEPLVNFECGGNKTDYHFLNVNWERDVQRPEKYYDIKIAKENDLYPVTGEAYEVFKASEIGNIFPLYDKFSQKIGYSYIDETGVEKPVFMGCYGFGTSRAMGILVEKYHDEKGIIWPKAIAPFKVHLIDIGEKGRVEASNIYERLQSNNIDVLWDERIGVSVGEKLADADLIGCPYRIIVSDKTLANNTVEVKERASNDLQLVEVEKMLEIIKL